MKQTFNGDENNNRKESLSDDEIKKAMTKTKVNPSERAKRESLSKAMEGIEFARNKASNRHQKAHRKNWVKGMGVTGLAAAIMALIIVNTEVFQDAFTSGNGTGTSPQEEIADENEEPVTPDEEKRPKTIEIVTYPEGMEETNTYQLVNEEDFPFTTYMPDNFISERMYVDNGLGIKFSSENSDVMMMEIVFFDAGTSEEEARELVNEELQLLGGVEELPSSEIEVDVPEWAIASYHHSEEKFGMLTLGSVDEQFFYIHDQYIIEAGDGWGPRKEVILEEWVWKETGEPLQEIEEGGEETGD
ncbi:hypothetical protein CR203_07475 [Salipaludibacillus neizhouensis]|uniref:Uncharacterized protein n=1 Tax=Salipaludibacillus neizhouensis TaxID=885475 RepID=A0A3A9KFC0_9BACI|nr:hypothetical protein [Salipaludibacillus neizhouensis]RKL68313.1 hypothetical protein CR203_07475 [Salipaludibacillus neizhouensis]